MSAKRRDRAEEHRERIAQIVTDIISELGIDGVTVRRVAERAGYSTTVVTHYFANKKDLLLYTYQSASKQSYQRVYQALMHDDSDLVAFVKALAYADRPEYWRVYLAFFQFALMDKNLLLEQERRTEDVRKMALEIMYKRGVKKSSPESNIAYNYTADLLISIQGLGLQSILHPSEWTYDKKEEFLEMIVSRCYSSLGV
ncbi:TetR/AcrR family transcriptional regulator [Aquisediminimonas sediminicola]|uniref:TetR/AcrR family transcriptional regulator n=1 Tax=Alteraquisediminimonas sediminicola TaxID=2676787 RepID=UPI001C8E3A53